MTFGRVTRLCCENGTEGTGTEAAGVLELELELELDGVEAQESTLGSSLRAFPWLLGCCF